MTIIINDSELITDTHAQAIAHGCNTKGIMRKGAAYAIKHLYGPAMYSEYVQKCSEERFQPGDIYSYIQEGLPILFNLAIQRKPGKHAKIEYVKTCLDKLAVELEQMRLTELAITPIGVMNGGLSIEEVIHEISSRFNHEKIFVTIYSRKDQDSINFHNPPELKGSFKYRENP